MIELKLRKAVFIVTYKKDVKKNVSYILLKRHKHWKGYEFPKGGIEKGENLLQTVKREVKEETGLKIIKIKKYPIKGYYLYPNMIRGRPEVAGQTYILFSAEVGEGKIKMDKREHSGFIWLPYGQAIKKLTWPNQKKCLTIVNRSLLDK